MIAGAAVMAVAVIGSRLALPTQASQRAPRTDPSRRPRQTTRVSGREQAVSRSASLSWKSACPVLTSISARQGRAQESCTLAIMAPTAQLSFRPGLTVPARRRTALTAILAAIYSSGRTPCGCFKQTMGRHQSQMGLHCSCQVRIKNTARVPAALTASSACREDGGVCVRPFPCASPYRLRILSTLPTIL